MSKLKFFIKYYGRPINKKILFQLIKKMLIGLLAGLVNGSNYVKCISLSNQKCMTQPTYTSLHPNEYSQEFHYYPFVVKLGRYVGSCNTLNGLSNKEYVKIKTVDLNLSVFNMISRINQSKTLINHISCECKYIFDEKNVIQINGKITINVNVGVKKSCMLKILFRIPLHVNVKNEII